jgi:hypothetical protein
VSSGTRPFALDPAPAFSDDLEIVDPFYLGQIHRAVEQLRHEPTAVTRNRKPLKRPVPCCPEATHELRVGEFRVLYRPAEPRVHLLRLGRKAHERLLPVRMGREERS